MSERSKIFREATLELSPASEVETADYADKQELGDDTGRMSPKQGPQMKSVYHP